MPLVIRPLAAADVEEAARIVSVAFGTHLGVADPEAPRDDRNSIGTRWRANPDAALGAWLDGRLVGCVLAANWGSVGWFGPLGVRPDYWGQGIAQALLAPAMELFARWGTEHIGLYTFAHSPKHLALYQKFGFWPGHLTTIMERPVDRKTSGEPATLFSALDSEERTDCLNGCNEVTGSILPGFDLAGEVRAVLDQSLGDTVLVAGDRLEAFAVVHSGPGTEAGTGTAFVKCAAVRAGPKAARHFDALLDAVEGFAAAGGFGTVTAGVNLARREAAQAMIARGYRTAIQGVAMHRGGGEGYNRAGVFALDDWR